MSISAVAWAKRQDTKTSGAKLVLMIVADYATFTEFQEPTISEGRHYAWPGIPTLAADCLMSERTVITHLNALETLDLVRREQRRDRDGRRTSDYLVLPVDNAGDNPWTTDQTGAYVDQVQNLHVKDAPTSGATSADRSTSRTTKEPPPPPTRAGKRKLPDDFEVTASMRAWYVREINSRIDGATEHQKFLDYWRGNGKLMADWEATWRNWMRRATESGGGPSSRPKGGGPTPTGPRYPSAQERSKAARDEHVKWMTMAETYMEQQGMDTGDILLMREIAEKIRYQHEAGNGDDTRTSGMYSGGEVIDAEIVPPREVTAGEAS